MGHRQLHEIAIGLDREGDLRRGFAHGLVQLMLERVGQAPWAIGFEDLAGIGGLAVADQRKG
jgi:hypothetical protein